MDQSQPMDFPLNYYLLKIWLIFIPAQFFWMNYRLGIIFRWGNLI